ncbi:MAG: hypothetical protein Q7S40_23045 [Opitutaceae bacterium]|nr:hypothetical protein [Opitutaceae bacterium]
MKRTAVMTWLALALYAGGLSLSVEAAETREATAAPVELPPMMVEESISSAPWFHVHVGGAEFLSRCSASTTRQFIEAWLTRMQLVRVLVPEDFLARMDVPTVIVLYAQDLQQTISAEIQRELQAGDDGRRDGDPVRGSRVNIAPNMRLSDRDMHASIVYIDESLFDASTLSIAPGHVRFLLQGRVPELPLWLVEGIERTWRTSDFVLEPITLRPLVWHNQDESDALARDASRPRALLPAAELFATDALRAAENRHPRRAATRASEQDLFFRWALVSGGRTREALWKLAARAAEGPVTGEVFEACFGFDFSELRDRLSDYLPKAVEEMARIQPGKLPPLPEFEVERATPNEIARVRGEWERLAIGHVQRRLPQAREPYIAQARRTLRRAFDAGDRDPRLLATMGLCEIDAGNEGGAREFLEPAIATGVVRPRGYYELGRLRFAALQRGVPDTKLFSFTELMPILEPLRRALTQAPPLPEVFVLLAEAWARCEMAPNAAEFAELETGARLFARRPAVGLSIALALARHGRKAEAAAILDATTGYTTDENTRAGITRLRTELAAASARPPADQLPAAGR